MRRIERGVVVLSVVLCFGLMAKVAGAQARNGDGAVTGSGSTGVGREREGGERDGGRPHLCGGGLAGCARRVVPRKLLLPEPFGPTRNESCAGSTSQVAMLL